MKKTVLQVLLLTLCLLFVLAACTPNEGDNAGTGTSGEAGTTAAPTEESTETPTEAPTEEPTEEVTTEEIPTGPIGDDEEGKYNGIHPA